MLQRSIAALMAFAVGWVVYMVAMVLTVYDGCLSLVFQPFMAAICSGLFVGAALLVGLVFKLPVLGRWWRSSFLWAGAIAAGSLFFLVLGYPLGLTATFTHPELGHKIRTLDPLVALAGYFGLLFALANWPLRRRPTGSA